MAMFTQTSLVLLTSCHIFPIHADVIIPVIPLLLMEKSDGVDELVDHDGQGYAAVVKT